MLLWGTLFIIDLRNKLAGGFASEVIGLSDFPRKLWCRREVRQRPANRVPCGCLPNIQEFLTDRKERAKMNKNTWPREFIAEIFGTFILVLMGDGVVANVALAPRVASGAYNWNTIAWGWGLAVVFAVYIAGGVSGAHINPAVTLGLAVKGDFPWQKVPHYIIGQLIGGFLGAIGVYLDYLEGLRSAGMPNVWCTGPGAIISQAAWGGPAKEVVGSFPVWNTFIDELIGTAVLLWIVCACIDMKNVGVTKWNLQPFMIGMGVAAIGFTLGGTSGYAINPARDLGPRIWGTLVGTTGLFEGTYWLVSPIIATIIGGCLGTLTYDWIITPGLPSEGEG
jgi:glycerol uptake facilitator protein